MPGPLLRAPPIRRHSRRRRGPENHPATTAQDRFRRAAISLVGTRRDKNVGGFARFDLLGYHQLDQRVISEQIDNLIAESVAGLMPVIAGEIAAVAVRAALAGDEAANEDMAARMEAELEQELEQRGREIEARAEALCLRVAELDQIESGLSASILDGKPLNLIKFDSVR